MILEIGKIQILPRIGIQIRNMKMVFNIYGTWRQVTFEKLMMKINDFFYSAKSFSHPVLYCAKIIVKMEDFLHNIIRGD